MASKWTIAERQSDDLFEHLCALRGFDPNAITPNYEEQLHDPYLLPDMDKAVALVEQAAKEKWPTVIFGDYDADGTPASVVLSSICEELDIPFRVVLPTRSEGYGLTSEAIKKLPSNTKLLITVDTGVTAVSEIALAKEKGITVIVLDHHLPKETLPEADAVVDAFRADSKYPFTGLCGCALAYKLAVALAKVFPDKITEAFQKWLLDLVAISTVADMMPIVGENRVLVHYGLQVLAHNRRPGLRALLQAAGLSADGITAGTIGFAIGPRLNAAGRLADNRPAYELLWTKHHGEAQRWATEVEKANRQRQQLVEELLKEVEAQLFAQNDRDDRLFVVSGEGWPTGVLGLAAGKLTGKYFRPAIVLSKKGGVLTGSARSTGQYSIIDGLTSQQKLLNRFGGHEQAAGLSLQEADFPKFVDGLKSHAAGLITPEDMVPTYQADALLRDGELSLETVESISRLQPFGLENSQPLFVIEKVEFGTPRSLGTSGQHLKWQALASSRPLEIIGFGLADKFKKAQTDVADVLGYLEKNTWQGRSSLQFRLVDWR